MFRTGQKDITVIKQKGVLGGFQEGRAEEKCKPHFVQFL